MDDDLFEALLGKLERVSPLWTETFASDPSIDVEGYKRLQGLVNRYGEENVRSAFESAIDFAIVPTGSDAMALTLSMARKRMTKGEL